jgi:hypothetical protein
MDGDVAYQHAPESRGGHSAGVSATHALAKRGRRRTLTWEERTARRLDRQRAYMEELKRKAAGSPAADEPANPDTGDTSVPATEAAGPGRAVPGEKMPAAPADKAAAAKAQAKTPTKRRSKEQKKKQPPQELTAEEAQRQQAQAQLRAYDEHRRQLMQLVRESSSAKVAPHWLDDAEQRMFWRLRQGLIEYRRALRLLREYGGATAAERRANAPVELVRAWRRGLKCTRWMHMLGVEVARRRGRLGRSGKYTAGPEMRWLRLRREWEHILASWSNLGDDAFDDAALGLNVGEDDDDEGAYGANAMIDDDGRRVFGEELVC